MDPHFHLTAWAKREMVNDIGRDTLSRNEAECGALANGSDQQLAFHEGGSSFSRSGVNRSG